VVEGHALGFDSVSGFGLVQALGRIDLDPLPLGSSAAAEIGDGVVVGGAGGRTRSVAKPHRRETGVRRLLGVSAGRGDLHLSRAPQLGRHRTDLNRGELIASARWQLEREREGKAEHVNMIVPIDLLKAGARRFAQVRPLSTSRRGPWLGMYTTEDR